MLKIWSCFKERLIILDHAHPAQTQDCLSARKSCLSLHPLPRTSSRGLGPVPLAALTAKTRRQNPVLRGPIPQSTGTKWVAARFNPLPTSLHPSLTRLRPIGHRFPSRFQAHGWGYASVHDFFRLASGWACNQPGPTAGQVLPKRKYRRPMRVCATLCGSGWTLPRLLRNRGSRTTDSL